MENSQGFEISKGDRFYQEGKLGTRGKNVSDMIGVYLQQAGFCLQLQESDSDSCDACYCFPYDHGYYCYSSSSWSSSCSSPNPIATVIMILVCLTLLKLFWVVTEENQFFYSHLCHSAMTEHVATPTQADCGPFWGLWNMS